MKNCKAHTKLFFYFIFSKRFFFIIEKSQCFALINRSTWLIDETAAAFAAHTANTHNAEGTKCDKEKVLFLCLGENWLPFPLFLPSVSNDGTCDHYRIQLFFWDRWDHRGGRTGLCWSDSSSSLRHMEEDRSRAEQTDRASQYRIGRRRWTTTGWRRRSLYSSGGHTRCTFQS